MKSSVIRSIFLIFAVYFCLTDSAFFAMGYLFLRKYMIYLYHHNRKGEAMRAFLMLFGGLIALVSLVLSVLSLYGKISNNIGLILLIIALMMISVARRL